MNVGRATVERAKAVQRDDPAAHEAAKRWATHVSALVEGEPGTIVPLRRAG